MRNFFKLQLLGTTALALTLINTWGVDLQAAFSGQGTFLQGDRVEARVRSGGRSRGGSFNRSSPSRSRSNTRPSTSSPSRSFNSRPSSSNDSPTRSSPSPRSTSPSVRSQPRTNNPVIVPIPVPIPYGQPGAGINSNPAPVPSPSSVPSNSGTSANPDPATPSPVNQTTSQTSPQNAWLLWLTILLGVAGLVVLAYVIWNALRSDRVPAAERELSNDKVTVTQLQVALLAQAREIQAQLSELSLQANTDTPEGLTELLQETVLALLRSPENWAYVRSRSQTVSDRAAAAQLFEQLSLQERSKFSAETLANVGGRIRRQALQVDLEADPAAYIVVTLLIGTEDDRPLIEAIHSAEDLQAALKHLGAITPDYLAIFELIWSPQSIADSLSYDDLLTEYTNMLPLG